MLFSSIGNGGTSDSERILKDFALISMVPVFKFGFAAPERFSMVPTTATVNSLLNFFSFCEAPSAAVALLKDDLDDSGTVTKVGEDNTAFVPALLDPSHKCHFLAYVCLCDFSTAEERFKPAIDSAMIFLLIQLEYLKTYPLNVIVISSRNIREITHHLKEVGVFSTEIQLSFSRS